MPYAKISLLDRQRLVNCYNAGRDWRRLAADLDIKRTTANLILKRYLEENRIEPRARGGVRRVKVSEQMMNALRRYVAEKPTITLNEMRERLLGEFPDSPAVSNQCLSKKLDGTLITLKDVRPVHAGWNAPGTKDARVAYMQWMLNEGHLQEHLVYVDECGFNLWTARSKGWSAAGERAVRITDGQRGPNVTVVLAVSPQLGLVHFACHVGGFTGERFTDFCSEVSALVDAPFVMIADNARAHAHVPPTHRDDQSVRFLPVYSPFLNATEMAISALKAAVKRRLTEPALVNELGDRVAAAQAAMTLHNWRLNILVRELQASMHHLTQNHCLRWHMHTLSYGQACLNREDIYA
jgi:hypothetical protein